MMLVECMRFAGYPTSHGIAEILQRKMGWEALGDRDVDEWYQLLWQKEYTPHPQYAGFKGLLYGGLDPRFVEHFEPKSEATIRLDEIRWGGVRRDGIPPLDRPEMIPADEATYLEESNIVFGVEINGDARAYPKRILAWHEMFKDTVGGVSINGVYCTLCGSMIIYETELNGAHHELGTSGFLYRSNKLMYDHATKSLWSTLYGEPVVGALVGQGIRLRRGQVVTTTWGEWRARHPETTVLSLDTGHHRDYGEGVAYRDYFATDRLMFTVPQTDDRLPNKQEVLAIRFDDELDERLAIDTDFLAEHPIYYDSLGSQRFVVLTDESGASRVYAAGEAKFVSQESDDQLTDEQGNQWTFTEDAITSESGEVFQRLPAHRAFWFAWYSMNPDTRLVQQSKESPLP